jgi:hypothetical protein
MRMQASYEQFLVDRPRWKINARDKKDRARNKKYLIKQALTAG